MKIETEWAMTGQLSRKQFLAFWATVGVVTVFSQPRSESFYLNGILVRFQDGLPIGCVLSDGEEIPFDPHRVLFAKREARVWKEAEIITLFKVKTSTQTDQLPVAWEFGTSGEHPRVTDLPDDVLSEQELGERGITTIQSDRITLRIRKTAFEEGELLASFKPNQKDRQKLMIILVDGPVVHRSYMKDKRYIGLKKILVNQDENLGRYTAQRDYLFDQQMEEVRQMSVSSVRKAYGIGKAEFLLYLKAQRALTGFISYEELIFAKALYQQSAPGLFIGPKWSTIPDTSVIFIAVGDEPLQTDQNDFSVAYYDELSRFNIRSIPLPDFGEKSQFRFLPRADQSYPNPDDLAKFQASPEGKALGYQYDPQTAGFLFRHELGHLDDSNEITADTRAMMSISAAWNKWRDSGYTDNSGYYFVFSLPEERGGYILTRKLERSLMNPSA